MKYFIDQEFKEGFHKPLFGKRRHYIDLISIGIVGEDGSEYYAISNEFDLKTIWNDKDTWLKDNVLNQIHTEFYKEQSGFAKYYGYGIPVDFTLKSMQYIIKEHGKSNQEIAEDIITFIYKEAWNVWYDDIGEFIDRGMRFGWHHEGPIEFYGYFSDYDWVLFCSLFGKMINLPHGFPMYCIDLKQMLDDKVKYYISTGYDLWKEKSDLPVKHSFETCLKRFKASSGYPKQDNEHNALADAYWNKQLYDFLKK